MRTHHGCGARVFIALLGGAAAWPLAANAQRSGRMQRIGFISAMAEKDPQGQLNVLAFQKGLLERGLNVGGSDRGGERAAVMLTLIQTVMRKPPRAGGSPLLLAIATIRSPDSKRSAPGDILRRPFPHNPATES
jgi:hypothetical protein